MPASRPSPHDWGSKAGMMPSVDAHFWNAAKASSLLMGS